MELTHRLWFNKKKNTPSLDNEIIYSPAISVTFLFRMDINFYLHFTLQEIAWLNSLMETDELIGYIELHFTVNNRMCKELQIISWRRGPLLLTDISPTNTTPFPPGDSGFGFWVTKPIISVPLFFRFFLALWIHTSAIDFKEFNRYFRKTENFAFGEINEQSFSNRIPWLGSHFMLIYTFLIIDVS